MSLRLVASVLGVFGLAILLTSPQAQSAQSQDAAENDEGIFDQVALLRNDDTAKSEDGVQPVGKGPVHEAFAEPVSNVAPQAPAIVPKQPPELIEELPPPEKPDGDNVQWISGYWAFDDDGQDFLWISGIWRNIPPGRQWVPGHFKQAADGWQWVAGFWAVADQGEINVVPLPPPEPVNEAEPPRPSDTATYISGNWVYYQTRYVWRPGFWCAYRPGWIWVPAHYNWTPCGFVFVEGYWDFPLQERGLLFAPCHIDRRVAFGVGFRFTPRFVVNDHCLMGALFVRPRSGCYFFGDFFEARYQTAGFVSWTEVRIGRGGCDPLFGYYRTHYHRDPRWERDLHELYHARRLGTAPRPPVTLVQQNTIINNININKNVNVKNVNNVVMLAPVTKVNQKVVKLEKLDNNRRLEEQKHADKLREVSKQRAKQETVLLAGRDSGKKDATLKHLKLDLPVQPEKKDKDGKVEVSRKKTPPPPPVVLKKDDRVVDRKNDDKKGDDKGKLPDIKKPDDKKVERKPDDKKPDDKKSDKKPDQKKPDIKKPEEKKPEKKPDEKKPDNKKPEEKKFEKKPEEKKPEDKKPDRNAGGSNKPPEIKKSDSSKPAKSNDNKSSSNNSDNKKEGKKK